MALLAVKHRIAQVTGALELGCARRRAVRTVHEKFTGQGIESSSQFIKRGFYSQFEYSILTVSRGNG
jgi:hypothetical protein